MLRRVGDDVGDDPHRRARRVDVGVADHELLEDVVLDGPGERLLRHALFLRRDDVERHHRQHGAVHGHRHAGLVERDAVEQRPHVVDGIDRHAGHADIAGDARMVGIVAAVGRQIEGDRQALLPAGEVAPVEGVRILRRREAGILADRPRPLDIHGRVGAAHERREARPGREEIEAGAVAFVVARLDGDPFRRLRAAPSAASGGAAAGICQGMAAKSVIAPPPRKASARRMKRSGSARSAAPAGTATTPRQVAATVRRPGSGRH